MTLALTIFGYEFARLRLEFDEHKTHRTVVDDAAKGVSRWFFKRMVK